MIDYWDRSSFTPISTDYFTIIERANSVQIAAVKISRIIFNMKFYIICNSKEANKQAFKIGWKAISMHSVCILMCD